MLILCVVIAFFVLMSKLSGVDPVAALIRGAKWVQAEAAKPIPARKPPAKDNSGAIALGVLGAGSIVIVYGVLAFGVYLVFQFLRWIFGV